MEVCLQGIFLRHIGNHNRHEKKGCRCIHQGPASGISVSSYVKKITDIHTVIDAGGKSPHRKQQLVAGAVAQDRQVGTGPAVKGCQEYSHAGNQINREEVVFSLKPYIPALHGPASFIRWSLLLNLSRMACYPHIRDNEEGSAHICLRCAAPYHYLMKC